MNNAFCTPQKLTSEEVSEVNVSSQGAQNCENAQTKSQEKHDCCNIQCADKMSCSTQRRIHFLFNEDEHHLDSPERFPHRQCKLNIDNTFQDNVREIHLKPHGIDISTDVSSDVFIKEDIHRDTDLMRIDYFNLYKGSPGISETVPKTYQVSTACNEKVHGQEKRDYNYDDKEVDDICKQSCVLNEQWSLQLPSSYNYTNIDNDMFSYKSTKIEESESFPACKSPPSLVETDCLHSFISAPVSSEKFVKPFQKEATRESFDLLPSIKTACAMSKVKSSSCFYHNAIDNLRFNSEHLNEYIHANVRTKTNVQILPDIIPFNDVDLVSCPVSENNLMPYMDQDYSSIFLARNSKVLSSLSWKLTTDKGHELSPSSHGNISSENSLDIKFNTAKCREDDNMIHKSDVCDAKVVCSCVEIGDEFLCHLYSSGREEKEDEITSGKNVINPVMESTFVREIFQEAAAEMINHVQYSDYEDEDSEISLVIDNAESDQVIRGSKAMEKVMMYKCKTPNKVRGSENRLKRLCSIKKRVPTLTTSSKKEQKSEISQKGKRSDHNSKQAENTTVIEKQHMKERSGNLEKTKMSSTRNLLRAQESETSPKDRITDHQNLHKMGGRYLCQVCPYSSPHKCNMLRHMLIHSGVKPYQCKLCDTSFTTKASCKKHLHIIHKIQYKDVGKENMIDVKFEDQHINQTVWEISLDGDSQLTTICGSCGINFHHHHRLQQHLHNSPDCHSVFAHKGCKASDSDTHANGLSNLNQTTLQGFEKKSTILSSDQDLKDMDRDLSEIHPCQLCKVNFPTPAILQQHMKSKHIDTFSNVLQKERTVAGSLKENETVGLSTLNDGINFDFNMRMHTGEKPFKRMKCNESSSQSSSFSLHLMTHVSKRPFKCDECDQQFNHISSYRKHKKNHIKDLLFKCNKCGKCFNQIHNLLKHMRAHAGEKPFKCDKCTKYFSKKIHLQKHMKTHLGKKPFKCDKCGRCYSEKVSFNKHIRAHGREKPFKCDKCAKCYNESRDLFRHMKSHTGNTTFKCEKCDKTFHKSQYLKKHMKTHSGEKPFECEKCGKSFQQSSHLYIHMRTHTGEKPFKCEKCGKYFTQSAYFYRHVKVHTGERPHKCDKCAKSFIDSYDLQRHLKNHPEKSQLECEKCGKCFNRVAYFKRHISTHTGE